VLLDGYVRVSSVGGREGERFGSPIVQREQIEAWIGAHGASLGELFEELDESGARSDRPLLSRAIERVEKGESGGVVVARLDRFGRSVIDGLRAVERIEAAGGRFVSVQDGFDLGSTTGRLVLQILFSIGEWELERVRGNWEVARARAIERGVYVGQEPFGYRRAEDGRLQIDAERSRVVRQIFERRAAGESYQRIASSLNEVGLRTREGLPFTVTAVLRMINNRAYRGEARHGALRNPDAHPAIVDEALWEQCQLRRRGPRGGREALLAGMIRCASCGQMMYASAPGNAKTVRHLVYRCNGHVGRCKAPAYVRGDVLEPMVEEFIFSRCQSAEGRKREKAATRLEAEAAAAEARLIAFRDRPILDGTLEGASFGEGLAERRQELDRALSEQAAVRREEPEAGVAAVAVERRWPELNLAGRRLAARQLLDCVIVARGRTPVIERSWIFRRGLAPLRREGKRLVGCFDPKANDGERLSPVPAGSEASLERELRGFLGRRDRWPPYVEFAQAGRGRLYARVLASGGPYYWAGKLRMTVPPNAARWNQEAIDGTLRRFLKGRTKWPGKAEFEAAGLLRLYDALKKRGGFARWAARFGLPYRRREAYRWQAERIERELMRVAQNGEFPTRRQLRGAGLGGLYEAIRRDGGVIHWSERLGLSLAPDRRARLQAENKLARR